MKRKDLKDATFEDAGDVDLDHDDHGFTVDGRPMTEADYDASDAELAERTERVRAVKGRPSLSGPGQHSPTVNARVSARTKEALHARAEREGVRESELVRQAVEELLTHSS